MESGATLALILAGLGQLLRSFQVNSGRAGQNRDLALTALLSALNETRAYLSRRGRRRNRKTEEMLVKLWAAAAVPLRHFDRDLAQRCTRKSDYWVNPENYSNEDISSLGIEIKDIQGRIKKVLES